MQIHSASGRVFDLEPLNNGKRPLTKGDRQMNSRLTRPKQGLMAGVACAIFLFSASAFALPHVTLPGGNTNAVGSSDGYGPIDTTQLNASAQGEGGFQWPLMSAMGLACPVWVLKQCSRT